MGSGEADRWGDFSRCCRPGFIGIKFGVFLVLAGLLWLAAREGLFDPRILGPVIFILAGLWIIVATSLRKRIEKGQ
jgi:apolipoprotein N-acyltransferase